MKFYQTAEWFWLKLKYLKTDKILSRSEFVKQFGAKDFSEDKYQQYLRIIKTKG